MVGEQINEFDFRARGSFLDQAVNHLLNEGLDFRAELGKRVRGQTIQIRRIRSAERRWSLRQGRTSSLRR